MNALTAAGSAATCSKQLDLPLPRSFLHGMVAMPPEFTWDGVCYTGPQLQSLDLERAKAIPGIVDVMVHKNFVGVLAIQQAQASLAIAQLRIRWKINEGCASTLPLIGSIFENAEPVSTADAGLTYHWTPSTPGGASKTYALADYRDDALTVWVAHESSQQLIAELAALSGISADAVTVVMIASPQPGGYDLAVEATLLSRHAKRPVKVQAGYVDAPEILTTKITSTEDGVAVERSYHLRARPSKAALLCGVSTKPPPGPQVSSLPASAPAVARVPVGNYAGEAAAKAEAFAESSYWDEVARRIGKDPLEARLERIDDARARRMIERVASHAQWFDGITSTEDVFRGRGFAYAQALDTSSSTPRTLMSAWVVDVSVCKESGQISIDRLTVGNDSSEIAHAEASPVEIETNVRDTVGRLLLAPPAFDDWGTEPDGESITSALSNTQIELVPTDRNASIAVDWTRATTLPAAAAIANAIHDATGIRLRNAPFGDTVPDLPAVKSYRSKRRAWAVAAGMAAAVAGTIATAWPWPKALAPVADIDTSIYSQAAIERGRRIASAGNCMVCHTADGGIENAGGRALPTPFGTIYTSNITPDKETGIGTWSFEAFDRAMREGIRQDGAHLYPAFPYTFFVKMSDGDMRSLYAYLMTQPAAKAEPVKNEMSYPFNVRELLAGWNLLYNRSEQFEPDPVQSTLWNRGAYLVEGVGHCAACHSPYNALGGQKSDKLNHLSGAFIKGWEAPALNYMTHSPNPWTESDFYEYLRTGYSARHGVASGPMAPVVQGLQELDNNDIKAMAHYLAGLPAPEADTRVATAPAQAEVAPEQDATMSSQLLAGKNVFSGACAACHDASGGPALFGARPLLSLSTNIHSSSPDNLIQIILHGIREPVDPGLGFMPGFRDSLNETQLANLLRYLRREFAPDKNAWTGLEGRISELLAQAPQ